MLHMMCMTWFLVSNRTLASSQTASKRVEDLTEDELLALIATKRRMAQMAVTGVVDQKVEN